MRNKLETLNRNMAIIVTYLKEYGSISLLNCFYLCSALSNNNLYDRLSKLRSNLDSFLDFKVLFPEYLSIINSNYESNVEPTVKSILFLADIGFLQLSENGIESTIKIDNLKNEKIHKYKYAKVVKIMGSVFQEESANIYINGAVKL